MINKHYTFESFDVSDLMEKIDGMHNLNQEIMAETMLLNAQFYIHVHMPFSYKRFNSSD